MFQHQTSLRIAYADTDQMGFVYYGNYARFFEIARVEAIRSLGYSYKQMEQSGIMMPVSEMSIKYIKPALYDEMITIQTSIPSLPTEHKITFDYRVVGEANELLVKASVHLYILHQATLQKSKLPSVLLMALQKFYEE